MSLLLTNATTEDGRLIDVQIIDDRIDSVADVADVADVAGSAGGGQAEPETVIDLTGRLLLPAPAEPHAHLDKALTAHIVANPAGDLGGAIEAWLAFRSTIGVDDYAARATAAAMMMASAGCTAVRTHVDIGADIGTTGVEALLRVKADLASTIDIQLVGLITGVTGGFDGASGPDQLAVLREGLDLGLDVVGGVPHIEQDPGRSIELLLELAAEFDRPIDLHADENLDPRSADLEILAQRVLATGFQPGVTASHCVALGMKPVDEQNRIAELAAEAGIAVVALPRTNLYLQSRQADVAPPRGLTALNALDRAGVVVAGGGDNLRDPFCPVGRADPLEAAGLLVLAGHRSPSAAYRAVAAGARTAMGLEPVAIEAGSVADLVAFAYDPAEPAPAGAVMAQIVGGAPTDRLVMKGGRPLGIER